MTGRVSLLAALAVILAAGCAYRVERRLAAPDARSTMDSEAEYLKAHMRDGGLYVLSGWEVRDEQRVVQGQGTRLGFNRDTMGVGRYVVSLDSVALFETNSVRVSSSIIPLTVITLGSLGVTAYCAANPKACFGSCPTFYVPGDDGKILAEGFSASVSPSLEATDLDALPGLHPVGREVRLVMRNEALETHVVRRADVLAAPRPAGGRVLAARDGTLRSASGFLSPGTCSGPEGSCRDALAALDGIERTSLADSLDLASREWIDLEFAIDAAGRELGIVIGSRQSLMPTYVFYQGLAFMGSRAVEWLAALERGKRDVRHHTGGIGRVLGGIDVLVPDGAGGWREVGVVRETGPLATDLRVIPLPALAARPLRVRLRMTRGMWRIDYVALVTLGPEVVPVRLAPAAVLRDDRLDGEARSRLLDPEDRLTTLPGDEYTLVYRLPDTEGRWDLFLETRGYYLEWMRAEWLAEENVLRAAQLFIDPASALRAMAPEFKRVEPEMERLFWSSRYASSR